MGPRLQSPTSTLFIIRENRDSQFQVGLEPSFDSIWDFDITNWVSLQPGKPAEAHHSLSVTVWKTDIQAGAGSKADLVQSLSGVQSFKENRRKKPGCLCLLELLLYNSTGAGKPATTRLSSPAKPEVCLSIHLLANSPRGEAGLKQHSKMEGKTVKPV